MELGPRIPAPHLTAKPDPTYRFRFMEIVRRHLRERRYSRRTEEAYAHWIRRYIVFNDRRHPRDLAEADVRQFLSALAVEEQVAASTQNQALAALVFLYGSVIGRSLQRIEGVSSARQSVRVPVVLSPIEWRAILRRLPHPARLAAVLMYGSGLRIRECMTLRVKDVDIARREVVVRDGKGAKDRRTPLAELCVPALERHFASELTRFQRDRQAHVRCTGLSPALLRKYPHADTEWGWWYVFPAARTTLDAAKVIRRHHLRRNARLVVLNVTIDNPSFWLTPFAP